MPDDSPTRNSGLRIGLGVAAAVSIALAAGWWRIRNGHETSPPHGGNAAQTSVQPLARAEISIEGMDCMMCAAGLQNKLRAVRGVAKAEVSFQDKQAVVDFDPTAVGRARLAEVIEADGFKVSAPEGSPQASVPSSGTAH